jgi:hypothetical protein
MGIRAGSRILASMPWEIYLSYLVSCFTGLRGRCVDVHGFFIMPSMRGFSIHMITTLYMLDVKRWCVLLHYTVC